jgi:hypothetical protein
MAPCSLSSLSAEQNSVRFWSICFMLNCLGNTFNFVNLMNVVAGVAGIGGAVTAVLVLACGPRDKEDDRSRIYKAALLLTLVLLPAFAYSIHVAVGLLQLLQFALGQFMQACCGGVQCVEAMIAPCNAAASAITSPQPIIIGTIIHMSNTILVGMIYAAKLTIALKKRTVPVEPNREAGKQSAEPVDV